jgi:integrase
VGTVVVDFDLVAGLRLRIATSPAAFNTRGTRPTGPDRGEGSSTEPWVAATTAAVVPALRFHDLRHVGNTLASDTGANLRQLMARMKHAAPHAALIYQHATAERDRAIADALGQMIQATLAATPDADDPADEDETA